MYLLQTSLILLAGLSSISCAAETTGFLFIDGKYLPAPHEVQVLDEKLVVGDQSYHAAGVDLSAWGDLKSNRSKDAKRRSTRARQTSLASSRIQLIRGTLRQQSPTAKTRSDVYVFHRLCDDVLRSVESGDVVALYANRPPLILQRSSHGRDLIQCLLDEKGQHPPADLAPVDKESWSILVAEFQSTSDFRTHANVQLDSLRSLEAANEMSSRIHRLGEQVSYPLTMLAMVFVVIGFGHLLSNKPKIPIAESKAVVSRSLLIVGMLSVVDLIWTMVAAQSGSMRELNPIGNHLIQNPMLLVTFKVSLVGFAIVVLYRLHTRPIAQVASWWSCLVLTLLTARWLTFNSMFL
jgi:Domain of unknown function (DUF5658)